MFEQDNWSLWDREKLIKFEDFVNDELDQAEDFGPFSEIYAQLTGAIPQANDIFRQQLEDQLIGIIARRTNPNEEMMKLSRPGRLHQIGWFVANLNLLAFSQKLRLPSKVRLVAATLTLVIVLLFAIRPSALEWSQDFSLRFLNHILGTGATPTSIATALSGPSPTASFTPTPTGTSYVSIYPLEATTVLENRSHQVIHQPAPAPTPPGTP